MTGIDRLSTRQPAGVDTPSEPTVLALGAAAGAFEALASGTARSVLAALGGSPAPASELADAVDTSLQNVCYHLERLEAAGLVEVVGTRYSEKGVEMDVYAPTGAPLVVHVEPGAEGPT